MTLALPHMETPSTERAAETDGKERGDSPTPRGVWRAIFYEAFDHEALRDDIQRSEHTGAWRVLSLMAGYGSDASEVRRWFDYDGLPVHITGVELCEARGPHLRKWCDDVYIGDWRKLLHVARMNEVGPLAEGRWLDLIVTNPDFKLIMNENPHESLPAVLLRHAPAVLMLHTMNAFVRNDEARRVWREYTPAAQWIVPGTVSFDGTSSVASDCYAASLWLRGHEGPTAVRMLDAEPEDFNRDSGMLKSNGEPYKCWRWRVPPGSEEPSEGLPAAPGWQR